MTRSGPTVLPSVCTLECGWGAWSRFGSLLPVNCLLRCTLALASFSFSSRPSSLCLHLLQEHGTGWKLKSEKDATKQKVIGVHRILWKNGSMRARETSSFRISKMCVVRTCSLPAFFRPCQFRILAHERTEAFRVRN